MSLSVKGFRTGYSSQVPMKRSSLSSCSGPCRLVPVPLPGGGGRCTSCGGWFPKSCSERNDLCLAETCLSVRVPPPHVRRGYIPGKWMPLSGLIIEVVACTVPSVRVGTSRAGAAGGLSGKLLRTGCSSQVLVNRGSPPSLSGLRGSFLHSSMFSVGTWQ